MEFKLIIGLTLVLFGTPAQGARILAVLPTFFMSHHIVMQPILRTLAEAGHELVVYSPFPLKNPPPNYTDVFLDSIHTENSNKNSFILEAIENPYWRCYDNMLHLYNAFLPGTFENENIKELLNSNEKFDLVITEPFISQEFTFIFGYKFKAPTIGIQTFFTNSLLNSHLGNSLSITSMPNDCMPHSNRMTFWQRFMNAFAILRGLYIYYNEHLPSVETKMRRYFPEMPPLLDMTKNLSLMFINDHLMADYAQPRPPTMVPVAGIHIEPEKPLPQDIKKFMDEAKDGVILLSLGTLVPDDIRPKEYFDSVINVFKKLPQRVIWKTMKENIEGLPPNVMLVKWMPQRDVLAHPKCSLFITHGGLGSQHETIYNGVPVIGIPYFTDQHRNVGFYVAQEIGIRIHPNDISEETLGLAIDTVLNDPKYRNNIRKLSKIFRDRPMTPKQAVVYWTEYVLRHGGAPDLKPAVTGLRWYQVALLDVVVIVAAIAIIFTLALFMVGRELLLIVFRKRKITLSDDKKIK